MSRESNEGDDELYRPTVPIDRRRFMQGTVMTGLGALLASGWSPVAAKDVTAGEGDGGEASQGEDDWGAPTLSIADRLEDRRYVVAGSRAYVMGTEDGSFPAMGFHTRGEMGGIWSPPIKLLDGIWFALDGEWLSATEFTSGYGYAQLDVPDHDGVSVSRTDFVPDGVRGTLFGLHLTAEEDRTIELVVDARSELMNSYPWGATTPSQLDFNLADEGAFDEEGGRLTFREQGEPPIENAAEHDWAAVVGATDDPTKGETGEGFWGPQSPPEIAPAEGEDPERYDDTAFGKGTGGELRYELDLAAGETRTIWIGVAGADFDGNSNDALDAAHDELDALLADPDAALAEKVEGRLALDDRSRFELPGNRQLERALDWSKQNLADCVLESQDLQVRDVDAGESYPEPAGTVEEVRFLAAGYPDYPWLFATDGEYTAFASVAAGQFEPAMDHCRALRDVSILLNDDSGKIVHEVVFDGSVYFGANDDEGNTDETVKFPSMVALCWRWSGDDDFRDDLYADAKAAMEYVFEELDEDADGWPEGLGNVEREGMGKEKLDVTVYAIRGLYDLADMARSKDDTGTAEWAAEKAAAMLDAFEETWWIPEIPQHADSIDTPDEDGNDNERIYQRHWIGVTPMEVELHVEGVGMPGLTSTDHGTDALALRETDCYGGISDDDESDQRRNEGLYHTGAPGCDDGSFAGTDDRTEEQIFSLNSAIMAVGEGNYGRLAADEQRRFIDANTKLQLPNPDEQPGAMPEIAPSPLYGRSIDRSFLERAQVLQAWGNYGTLWPVIHQWLGIAPDLGRDRLSVVPQVPPEHPRVEGENVRVGDGAIAVTAGASERVYRTEVSLDSDLAVDELRLGHVLPADGEVQWVKLDGERTEYETHETNRGLEVFVTVEPAASHTLRVKAE